MKVARRARRDGSGNVNYYFSDHLGSSRVVTNSAGTILDDCDFTPFGQERCVSSSSGNTYKFTGKERDPIAEGGKDYFPARYYVNGFGRWLSPDEYTGGPTSAYGPPDPAPPGALPYADITNPQSLNKYAYVYNNPLRYVDPTGRFCLKAIWGGNCNDDRPPSIVKRPVPPPWLRGNPIYPSKDQAARGAVHALRAAAAQRPVEHGNVVVKVGQVGWTYGDPVTQGSKTSVNPDASVWTGEEPATTPTKWNPLPMAPGLTKEGEAHVHVETPGVVTTRFSYRDVYHAGLQGITSYLGPTQGGVLKYDTNTNQQSWLEPPED